MNKHRDKIPIRTICISLSLLTHLLLLLPMREFGAYKFAGPVGPLRAVMVDLAQPGEDAGSAPVGSVRETAGVAEDAKGEADPAPAGAATPGFENDFPEAMRSGAGVVGIAAPQKAGPRRRAEPATDGAMTNATDGDATSTGKAGPAAPVGESAEVAAPGSAPGRHSPADEVQPHMRSAGEFSATAGEKLTYRISMFGIPVGSAELEAINERGEVRITLRVKSAPVFSSVYPVDDLVETRHIGGNFIVTRVRQQEGAFRSDRGFTIFSREKKVFWIDRLTNRTSQETIPNGEVVDIVSGLYRLRNRPLRIGRTEMLHVYDSGNYSLLPVEVLRRDRVRLPGLGEIDTMVIKPLLKSEGIFERTRDVTIWLTDDDFRAPVRVEMQIPLGKATVELISADTDQFHSIQIDPA